MQLFINYTLIVTIVIFGAMTKNNNSNNAVVKRHDSQTRDVIIIILMIITNRCVRAYAMQIDNAAAIMNDDVTATRGQATGCNPHTNAV